MVKIYDIIVVGGGASGLMAAYGAAASESHPRVAVLEKMPRPARKIMISGKGRCNYTNMKDWEDFSAHIRSNARLVKSAFYNLTPQGMVSFLEEHELESVVERGDRVFPSSHKSVDVVDALVAAVSRLGVDVLTNTEVLSIEKNEDAGGDAGLNFSVQCRGAEYKARKLIIATGGLSYPSTGSSGDGYRFAEMLGHTLKACCPSLTALVPENYKLGAQDGAASVSDTQEGRYTDPQYAKYHVDRKLPLSEQGKALCGIQLKNIALSLTVDGKCVRSAEGDIDFTDGGIEGPIGFSLSRDAVKALLAGSRVMLSLDMKPAVPQEKLYDSTLALWNEIREDPRSHGKSARDLLKVLLGKLMPWMLVQPFIKANPNVLAGDKNHRRVEIRNVAANLKDWHFPLCGFVGYERCVVTAGGVPADELVPKTLESKRCPSLYFCGEVIDIDADTGGYNLQMAFSTGYLAGGSAARSL